MRKFTKEKKISAVKQYLDGVLGHKRVAKHLGVPPSMLYLWISLYEEWGHAIFDTSYTSHSPTFKLEVLNDMADTGRSLTQTAVKYRLTSTGMIANWKRAFEREGVNGLYPKRKGRPHVKKKEQSKKELTEIERLEEKVKYLEMENAYLKKLRALVQEEEQSQTNSRRK